MQGTFVNLCYTMENHAIATMITYFGSTDHGLGTEVDRVLEGGTSSTDIYIYIYIYICVFRQHFFVNANFIKHNRHFMSTYFLLDPFEFPYYFYCILGELIYVLSIVACIPSTFCPTLGHHQGRIYYKSDVTFVLAYYNCVRASLPLKVFGVCFWMWFYI